MPHFAIDNIHFENGTATVIFLKKQNQKEKNIGITPTNDLAFQHTADIIHLCIMDESYLHNSSLHHTSTLGNASGS